MSITRGFKSVFHETCKLFLPSEFSTPYTPWMDAKMLAWSIHRAADFCWTASSPSSCWNGFNPAFLNMDQPVVKQAADVKHRLLLEEAARGCGRQWKIMRFKRWILPFCWILLLSALTRVSWWQCLLLGATFQGKACSRRLNRLHSSTRVPDSQRHWYGDSHQRVARNMSS